MCFGIFKFLFGSNEQNQPPDAQTNHEYKKTGSGGLSSTVIDAEFSDGKSSSSSSGESDNSGSSSSNDEFDEENIFANKGEGVELQKEEIKKPKDEDIEGEGTGNVDLLHFDVDQAKKEEKKRFGANKHENFKKKGKVMMKKRKLKLKKKEPVKKTEVE